MAGCLAIANEDMRNHTNNGPTNSIMALPHSPQIHLMERTGATINYEGIQERQYNTNPMTDFYHEDTWSKRNNFNEPYNYSHENP